MFDDGISPNIFSPAYMDSYQYHTYDKNFSHYQVRYSSNKTINFMLQNGDIDYQAPSNMNYQYFQQIDIHNADDLKNSDFACALNRSWYATPLNVFYNDYTKTLTIKPFTDDQLITFD